MVSDWRQGSCAKLPNLRARPLPILVVSFVVAAAVTFALVPAASSVDLPKPACSLLSKSDASRILKSTVREEGGGAGGSICVFRGSSSSGLFVSDIPNTKKWLSATKSALSAAVVGKRHKVSIQGATGYYEQARLGVDGGAPTGSVFDVTHQGYLVAVGAVGVSNTRLAAQEALTTVLKKL